MKRLRLRTRASAGWGLVWLLVAAEVTRGAADFVSAASDFVRQSARSLLAPGTSASVFQQLEINNSSVARNNSTRRCYCTPPDRSYPPSASSCWPDADVWESELGTQLQGRLVAVDPVTGHKNYHRQCQDRYMGRPGRNAPRYPEDPASGMCMQTHDCEHEFCDEDNDRSNLPAWIVEARVVEDVQHAISFANLYDIPVTIKTSGHSYAGSSTGPDSLLIWMHHFEKYGKMGSFMDSCGTNYENTLKMGGGQTWEEAYTAVGDRFNVVGGGCPEVSAAGGWLMGGGLSALSPSYGLGVDNVLNFEIVTADAQVIQVDRCSHPELFWALRGGGGGTFGVVTSVHYRLYEVEHSLLASHMRIFPNPQDTNLTMYMDTIYSWLDFWIEKSPNLDRRWGGYWANNGFIGGLKFMGSQEEADATFLTALHEWMDAQPAEQRRYIRYFALEHVPTISMLKAIVDPTTLTDDGGYEEFKIGSRLFPRDFVVNNATQTRAVLKRLADAELYHDPATGALRHESRSFHYLLGGAVAEVHPDATAVNPAFRGALWQVNVIDGSYGINKLWPIQWHDLMDQLRKGTPEGAPGYNHAAKDEPDWENTFWGKHTARLTATKETYDPKHRFNCYHCVGFSRTCAETRAPPIATVAAAVQNQFGFARSPGWAGDVARLSGHLLQRVGDGVQATLGRIWANVVLVSRLVAWKVRADWPE